MAARALKRRRRSDPMPAKTVFLPVMNPSGLLAASAAMVGRLSDMTPRSLASERRVEGEIVRRGELLCWGLSARSRAVYDDTAAAEELEKPAAEEKRTKWRSIVRLLLSLLLL